MRVPWWFSGQCLVLTTQGSLVQILYWGKQSALSVSRQVLVRVPHTNSGRHLLTCGCGCWKLILLSFYRRVFLYSCVVLVYSVIIETSLAYHHTLDTCVVVVLMSAGYCIIGSSLSASCLIPCLNASTHSSSDITAVIGASISYYLLSLSLLWWL